MAGKYQEIEAEIGDALAEIDPAMRLDSPLLTGRRPLADRSAEAVLPIVARELAARDAVIEQIRAILAKADAMKPENYKTGQSHLPPAFREVNYREAFFALAGIVNEIEASLSSLPSTGDDSDE